MLRHQFPPIRLVVRIAGHLLIKRGPAFSLRESAQSWKELLLDLKRRGLAMGPELAVADGALDFWQAVEDVWPRTRGQRCWVHKTANVLNKLQTAQVVFRHRCQW